jgi:endo-1,4-beta-xylanase
MNKKLTIWMATAMASGVIVTAAAEPALNDVFSADFLIGTAVNRWQFSNETNEDVPIIEKHFNTITPENALKWGSLHRQPDEFSFEAADKFVEFGEKRGMKIIGHTLVWHSQTPRWVFQDEDGNPASREQLLERMRNHILTVAGRYKGRIHGWDVVNEALNDDGTLRQSPWLRIIGEDYLVKAFEFAHEADPEAELYYNDYSLHRPDKRAGVVKLIKMLQDAGVRVDGIGMQAHYRLETPALELIEDSVKAYIETGLNVMFTELDIKAIPTPGPGTADISQSRSGGDARWNPYPDGLPDNVQHQLANRYAEIFNMLLKYREKVTRVTFWGVTDQSSWLNNFPIRGRTDYPLLFGRDRQPKPAFWSVVKLRSPHAKPVE